MSFIKTNVFSLKKEEFVSTAALFTKDEGFFFLHTGQGKSYLFLYPLKAVKESSWQALEQKIDLENTWVGFFSFEMAKTVEKDKPIPVHALDLPYSYFQVSKVECLYNLEKEELQVTLNTQEEALEKFLDPSFWKQNRLMPFTVKEPKITHLEDSQKFFQKVEKAKEFIYQGEIYQVNLSHNIVFEADIDPYLYFLELIKTNPAPYAFFIHLFDQTFISLSPELLIKKEKEILTTRPIKGTRPRGKNEQEDLILKEKLKTSSKEQAELLMITDLMRNDLGRVAKPCTIKVLEPFFLESYSTVHHLVSTVTCIKQENRSNIEILRNVFPGGSISGCPKLRALEIIYELEEEARGLYTGSVGFFEKGGNFLFNIAIRTVVKKGKNFHLRVGGGIVIDSLVEKEYDETLHKGRPFFNVLGITI
jgi:para-aminobenzoate synthetase component 1